jgi:hypothetical protein
MSPIHHKCHQTTVCQIENKIENLASVSGVAVIIVAFQAADPGSTPG